MGKKLDIKIEWIVRAYRFALNSLKKEADKGNIKNEGMMLRGE